MYIKDNMHFTPEGAKTLAKIISVEIEHKSELKPIAGKVRLKKMHYIKQSIEQI